MNSLISESRGRPGDDPIFTINAAANARKAQGEPVINASLGALLDDDGSLYVAQFSSGKAYPIKLERI